MISFEQTSLFNHQDHIVGTLDLTFVEAKKLPNIALHPIAKCRRSNFLLYHDSQSMERALVFSDEEDEASRGNPLAEFHDRPKIARLGDSVFFCNPERTLYGGLARHLSAEKIFLPFSPNQISNGQPLPSLHSPPLQNVSAAPGTHPFQESVGPFASEIARLVRPFH